MEASFQLQFASKVYSNMWTTQRDHSTCFLNQSKCTTFVFIKIIAFLKKSLPFKKLQNLSLLIEKKNLIKQNKVWICESFTYSLGKNSHSTQNNME